MKRNLLLLLLILAAVLLSATVCFAATDTEVQCADALHELGLFSGTGVNKDGTPIYSLDRAPSRAEAITMLVGLLGKSEEAVSQEWETPFTDVPAWAQPYVGYAYNNGLTSGVSPTQFGSSELASETQYITFVLKALGYDSGADFQWDKAKSLSNKLGITYGDPNTKFMRGDVVEISYYALKANLKNSDKTLIESLYDNKAVETTEIAKVTRDKKSEDGTKIYLPDEARDGISYAEVASAYGYDNLYYTVNPKTEEEHWNNVRYVMLTGQWDYTKDSRIPGKKTSDCKWTGIKNNSSEEGQYLICRMDVAMMSYFSGGNYNVFFYYNNTGYHVTTGDYDIDKFPTPETIREQIIDTYVYAREKYNEFRSEGLITETSTQYEIAKVYSDWFCSIKVLASVPDDRVPHHEYNWELDISTAYSALINHTSMCTGKAGAYCLFMRMEGITAYGLVTGDSGHPGKRNGHIVPWLLLDGKEYIYEHNMNVGLLPVDKEVSSAGTTETTEHLFQKYYYNMILKEAGLEYDASFENKSYWNDDGDALTREEWNKYMEQYRKNQ